MAASGSLHEWPLGAPQVAPGALGEATEGGFKIPVHSGPSSMASALCGPSIDGYQASDSSPPPEVTNATSAGSHTNQGVEPPLKRPRSESVDAGATLAEPESTVGGDMPVASACLAAEESEHISRNQAHQQREEPGHQEYGVSSKVDTAPAAKNEAERSTSELFAKSQGRECPGVLIDPANNSAEAEGRGRGISLGVFFETAGEDDIDLDSLLMTQEGSPSRHSALPAPQADGNSSDAALRASSLPAASGERPKKSASTADATTAKAAEAQLPNPLFSGVVENSGAAVVEGSESGHLAIGGELLVGKGVSVDAASSTSAAAAEGTTADAATADGSTSGSANGPSSPGAYSNLDFSNTLSGNVNSGCTSGNAEISSSSSADRGTDAADTATRDTNSSSSSSSRSNNLVVGTESREDEVIDLSNIEVVDSDDGAGVPVVDVETEAVCIESLPSSSESNRGGGAQDRDSQRPPPASPTAVVLDSDDDDVVELRFRQAVPFSVQEYSQYMMRHPGLFPHSGFTGFPGMPMSAHLRHRLLQEEMAQRRDDDEASSNPALPRCPICLKRYRQQQQEEASMPEQKSATDDANSSHAGGESGKSASQSEQNSSTNTLPRQDNWEPPASHPPPVPPPDSEESDRDHVVALKCGHVFCKGCIQVALRTRRQCPICRVVLRGSRPYQRIFL